MYGKFLLRTEVKICKMVNLVLIYFEKELSTSATFHGEQF